MPQERRCTLLILEWLANGRHYAAEAMLFRQSAIVWC